MSEAGNKFWSLGAVAETEKTVSQSVTSEEVIDALLSDDVLGTLEGERLRMNFLFNLIRNWKQHYQGLDGSSYTIGDVPRALVIHTDNTFKDLSQSDGHGRVIVTFKGRRFAIGSKQGGLNVTPVKLEAVALISVKSERPNDRFVLEKWKKSLLDSISLTPGVDLLLTKLCAGDLPPVLAALDFTFRLREHSENDLLLISKKTAPGVSMYISMSKGKFKDLTLDSIASLTSMRLFHGEKIIYRWVYTSDGPLAVRRLKQES